MLVGSATTITVVLPPLAGAVEAAADEVAAALGALDGLAAALAAGLGDAWATMPLPASNSTLVKAPDTAASVTPRWVYGRWSLKPSSTHRTWWPVVTLWMTKDESVVWKMPLTPMGTTSPGAVGGTSRNRW
jgi:hypothetical protein